MTASSTRYNSARNRKVIDRARRLQILQVLLICLAFVVASCDSADSMSDGARVALSVKGTALQSSDQSLLHKRAPNEVSFSAALIGFGKIELKTADDVEEPESVEENEDEYHFDGPYVVDLLSGTSEPAFEEAPIEPGFYSKIDMEMMPVLDAGLSVFVEGIWTKDDGSEVPLQFTYNQTEDFKVEDPGGFEIPEEGLYHVLLVIDLDTWFAEIDLSSAVEDNDGVIYLNKDSNRDLADVIEARLEAASELGADADADGEIDEEG